MDIIGKMEGLKILAILLFVFVDTAVCKMSTNILMNPSFELEGDWELLERHGLWDIQEADPDLTILTEEQSHQGKRALKIGPTDQRFSTKHDCAWANQYVFISNKPYPSSQLTFSVFSKGVESSKLLISLAISYHDDSHLFAEITPVQHNNHDSFEETCSTIPSYGSIRALLVTVIVDEQTSKPVYVDDISAVIGSQNKTCSTYTKSFPVRRHAVTSFLNPQLEFPSGTFTIATQLTIDRQANLARLASVWQGPISAVLFMIGDSNSVREKLKSFIDFYQTTEDVRKYVTVHLVTEDTLHHSDSLWYPANYLRNIAISSVTTGQVFYIDIDILPSFTAAECKAVVQRVRFINMCNKCAYIFPLYNSKNPSGEVPENKQALIAEVKKGVRESGFEPYGISHSAVKYTKWETTDDPYKIEYVQNMEPYFAVSTDAPIMNDMFIGYGRDKCAYSRDLHNAGYEFWVVNNLFLLNFKEQSGQPTIIKRSPKIPFRMVLAAAFNKGDVSNGFIRYPLKVEQSNTHKMYSKPISGDTVNQCDKFTGSETVGDGKCSKQEKITEDNGLTCSSILPKHWEFSSFTFPLKHAGAYIERTEKLLEQLMKGFGIWTLIQIGWDVNAMSSVVGILMHVESIVNIHPNSKKNSYSEQGIRRVYHGEGSTKDILSHVQFRDPSLPKVYYIYTEEFTEGSVDYIISTANTADIILIEDEYVDLKDLQVKMCEHHPTWRIYKEKKYTLLARHLENPVTLLTAPRPLPSIITDPTIGACQPIQVDIILLTKRRPLQTLAFLDSLADMVTGINKVWLLQKAGGDSFKKGYDKVNKCMKKRLDLVTVTDEDRKMGPALEEILKKSTARYVIICVDEMVWMKPFDLQQVACLLEHNNQDMISFQLRLGKNLDVYQKEYKGERFFPLQSHPDIIAFYPENLKGDFSYLVHVDAMVVSKDRLEQDLSGKWNEIKSTQTLEFGWLGLKLPEYCRQWHLMYTESRFVNNRLKEDGRVEKVDTAMEGSNILLDILMSGKKIDVQDFALKYEKKITSTHIHVPVSYTKWKC